MTITTDETYRDTVTVTSVTNGANDNGDFYVNNDESYDTAAAIQYEYSVNLYSTLDGDNAFQLKTSMCTASRFLHALLQSV